MWVYGGASVANMVFICGCYSLWPTWTYPKSLQISCMIIRNVTESTVNV